MHDPTIMTCMVGAIVESAGFRKGLFVPTVVLTAFTSCMYLLAAKKELGRSGSGRGRGTGRGSGGGAEAGGRGERQESGSEEEEEEQEEQER